MALNVGGKIYADRKYKEGTEPVNLIPFEELLAAYETLRTLFEFETYPAASEGMRAIKGYCYKHYSQECIAIDF